MSEYGLLSRWFQSDPFIPGINYALAFCAGAIAGYVNLDIAAFLFGVYVLIAISARIGANIEYNKTQDSP